MKSVFLFPRPSLSVDLHCLTQVLALEAVRLSSPCLFAQAEASPFALGTDHVVFFFFFPYRRPTEQGQGPNPQPHGS